MRILVAAVVCLCALRAGEIDLSSAVVVVRSGDVPKAEKTAALVLAQEVEKRTGIRLALSTTRPAGKPAIVLASAPGPKPEAYRLQAVGDTVTLTGADGRGVLFGVGELLRRLDWAPGRLRLAEPLDIATAPAYPIRGHQLGYRAQANSYDAFDVHQYEQYIRELAFFGVNSIENIPFQDSRPTPVMKVPRREMNRAISQICDRYGLDYWIWTPADFDLRDTAKRAALLDEFAGLFRDSPQLTGVFFPGGDPGSNPPELVLPFLADVGRLMKPLHPAARIWISLQWFTPAQADEVYRYIEREKPEWFAGLVAGPSSPPVAQTRLRLAPQYRLRLYPDLTHNKLCQYPVPQWDQAYALTLGREAVNPRPAEFAQIHNRWAAYSDGFISYSDGVHDDVNKTVWSALAWDPSRPVRDILVDYARVYFDPRVAGDAADAILALERNWRGPLVDNGAVEATLADWQRLEHRAPQLESQWRWQMCLLRAYYDAYVRRRLIRETGLEAEANAILLDAGQRGAGRSVADATAALERAVREPASPDVRARIADLCDKLFHSIGLQTSVAKYYASGEERGAVLDFVDYPLNNRWWLEDEFAKVARLGTEAEKVRRLVELARWEHPGPGSFYDNVGNASKSPRVERAEAESGGPTFWWWEEGRSRARLTWQVTMWPRAMVYEGLDPAAKYVVRTTGYGDAILRIAGERIEPARRGREMGEFTEFVVPAPAVRERRLVLNWERPAGEEKLNWRRRSRLAEVWLLRR